VGDLRHMDTFPQKLDVILSDPELRFKDFNYGYSSLWKKAYLIGLL